MVFHSRPKQESVINAVCIFLIAIGCVIIYANSLYVPFIFDDRPFIVNDESVHITSLSGGKLINAACDGSPGQRPLSNISFALNYYFSGLDPFGYHLFNMMMHSLSGIFLFLLLCETLKIGSSGNLFRHHTEQSVTRKPNPDLKAVILAAVLIWLFHPLHTESVTYICQRMTSMAAMFYILSMLLYVKWRLPMRQPHRYRFRRLFLFFGFVAAGGCALLSKPNAATLPLMILLYEWFFIQDLRFDRLRHRFIWAIAAVFLVSVFALVFLGSSPVDRVLSAYTRRDFTLYQRVLTEFRVVILYLSQIMFPDYRRLNMDYGFPISDGLISPPTTVLAMSAMTAMIIGAAVVSKKNRLAGFSILWFLGNLVIESTVIGLEIIFEHRTYLPSMFLLPVMVILLIKWIRFRKIAYAIICALILISGYWTWQRNQIWQDELVLWQDCVIKSPEKTRPHYNLGCLFLQHKKPEQAVPFFYKALAMEPGFKDLHYNLGCALSETKAYPEAAAQLMKALELDPDHADAHTNLANVLSEMGKPDLALFHYRRAAELKPNNSAYQKNLGVALFSQGMLDEARIYYQKALQLAPDDIGVLSDLGYLQFLKNDIQSAMEHYQRALRLSPDNGEIHGRIGDLLVEKKDFNNAITHYIKALEANPDDGQSHYNLAIAYYRAGRPDMARKHFRMAEKISPFLKFPDAMNE